MAFDNDAFPPPFFEEQITQENGLFVEFPDACRFRECLDFHGFPSNELNENQCNDYITSLQHCPCCSSAFIEGHRNYFIPEHSDFLKHMLYMKFSSIEELLQTYPHADEESLRLVRNADTRREPLHEGPVLRMLRDIPDPLLAESRVSFVEFLKKMYIYSFGFVKGRYCYYFNVYFNAIIYLTSTLFHITSTLT